MAIALVGQSDIAPGGAGTSPLVASYTSAAGNTLIITGHLYDFNTGDFVAPTGITDTAGNTWQISTSSAQVPVTIQTPPLCSIADPSDGGSAHMANWVAWCVNAAAITSVTVSWEGGISTWTRLSISEWSGIVQFSNSWAGGSTSTASSSVTTGPVNLPATGMLVVGALDFGGVGTETLPSGWTPFGSQPNLGYYLPPSSVGTSYSPVFTNTVTASWVAALAVFSPVALSSNTGTQAVRSKLPRGPYVLGNPGLVYQVSRDGTP